MEWTARPVPAEPELSPFEQRLAGAGFKLRRIFETSIIPLDNGLAGSVEWVQISEYNLTSAIVFSLRRRGYRLATPDEYVEELAKLKPLGRIRVCLFEVQGEGLGQGKSGYGALVAMESIQREISSIATGDGFDVCCTFAAVKL